MHNENMEEIKSISMQNVTFSYKGKKRYVFEDFSVDIEPNHITGIIGRNGQGKTTLMNLIAGKFEPDEGIIEIDGKNPATDIGTAKRIIYVAGVMSYSEIKLKKIIEEYRLMYEKFDEEFAYKLMELFGLNKKAKIKNLSKGQETIFNFCCLPPSISWTLWRSPPTGPSPVSTIRTPCIKRSRASSGRSSVRWRSATPRASRCWWVRYPSRRTSF